MNKQRIILLGLLLAVVTLALYLPALSFDFLNYDDSDYVAQNPHIKNGLNWNSLTWAFTNAYASNWHPLTWLSHMLDWQLYGPRPWGHHLTNVLLHTINGILLFRALLRMTGAVWRSFFVAALFAWHPLHVESVAWVAERKDVLSAFFWITTLAAYTRYAKKPGFRPYLMALLLFTLGLLCKPMVVSLPFVLLLLDFWPLNRLDSNFPKARTLSALTVEKIPFLVLSLASCIVTLWAQHIGNSVMSVEKVSVGFRVGHAFIAYAKYLGKTFYPAHLAVFYPYPASVALWSLVFALLLLGGLSCLALAKARTSPWLPVGWFWFLGTLVPVIGIVQVGAQDLADRYTYIPSVGLFIALVWTVAELRHKLKVSQSAIAWGTSGVLAACLLATGVQLRYWKNTTTLFEHDQDVAGSSGIASVILGSELARAGRVDDAIAIYLKALDLNPDFAECHYSLGKAYLSQEKVALAVAQFGDATRLDPRLAPAHNGLGVALAKEGRWDEAISESRQALQLKNDDASFHLNLANALVNKHAWDDAVASYEKALSLSPDIEEAQRNLGIALIASGRFGPALPHLLEAVRLNPNDGYAHYKLAVAYGQQGNIPEAFAYYEKSIQLLPGSAEPLNNLAWILAVNGEPRFRNGAQAVQLAKRACELTGGNQPIFLQTLAAACAESSDYPDAVAFATKARDLAVAGNQPDVARKCGALLQLFEAGKPCHDNSAPAFGIAP